MSDRYNRVPRSATARQLRDKLKEEGLDKLLEDSAAGPMNAFNSCKYILKLNRLDIYVNTTRKNCICIIETNRQVNAFNSCKYIGKMNLVDIYMNTTRKRSRGLVEINRQVNRCCERILM